MTDTARIHAAMESSGGNLRGAARQLGMSSLQLKDIIKLDESLRTRWVKGEDEKGAPGAESIIHRPMPATVTLGKDKLSMEEAKKIADAAAAEDSSLRDGLLNLGVRGDALEMALAMQQVQKKHFTRCIEILGGGITKSSLDVMVEIDKINKRLNEAGVPLDEQHMLREDRRGLLDILGRFKDKVDKSALIQATVKKLEAEAKSGGKGRSGKPAFGVLVQGERVEIHDHSGGGNGPSGVEQH